MKIGPAFVTAQAIGLALMPAAITAAQSGGGFTVTRSTIDGGGVTSVGGDFAVRGSIGQHDASAVVSTGGEFAIAGGFWGRVPNLPDRIFADGFESE